MKFFLFIFAVWTARNCRELCAKGTRNPGEGDLLQTSSGETSSTLEGGNMRGQQAGLVLWLPLLFSLIQWIRIRDGFQFFYDPWILDPFPRSRMEKNSEPGSGINIPDHISQTLAKIYKFFGLKILGFFECWDGNPANFLTLWAKTTFAVAQSIRVSRAGVAYRVAGVGRVDTPPPLPSFPSLTSLLFISG